MWTLCYDKHYGCLRNWFPFVNHLERKGISTFEGAVKEVCTYANSLVNKKVSPNESYKLITMDSKFCEIRITGEVPEFHYALKYMLCYVINYLNIPELKVVVLMYLSF